MKLIAEQIQDVEIQDVEIQDVTEATETQEA